MMGLDKTQRGLALCDCRLVALYYRPLHTIKWDGLRDVDLQFLLTFVISNFQGTGWLVANIVVFLLTAWLTVMTSSPFVLFTPSLHSHPLSSRNFL